jgi:hypothetical protein
MAIKGCLELQSFNPQDSEEEAHAIKIDMVADDLKHISSPDCPDFHPCPV